MCLPPSCLAFLQASCWPTQHDRRPSVRRAQGQGLALQPYNPPRVARPSTCPQWCAHARTCTISVATHMAISVAIAAAAPTTAARLLPPLKLLACSSGVRSAALVAFSPPHAQGPAWLPLRAAPTEGTATTCRAEDFAVAPWAAARNECALRKCIAILIVCPFDLQLGVLT
jgi:hypothetical protein